MLAMALLAGCATSRGFGKGLTVEANGTRVMAGTVESIVQIPASKAQSERSTFENAAEGGTVSGIEDVMKDAIGNDVAGAVSLYQAYKVLTGPTDGARTHRVQPRYCLCHCSKSLTNCRRDAASGNARAGMMSALAEALVMIT